MMIMENSLGSNVFP